MGSTSFLGFSYPNLLVFLNLLFLGTYIIFLSQVSGLSLGYFGGHIFDRLTINRFGASLFGAPLSVATLSALILLLTDESLEQRQKPRTGNEGDCGVRSVFI